MATSIRVEDRTVFFDNNIYRHYLVSEKFRGHTNGINFIETTPDFTTIEIIQRSNSDTVSTEVVLLCGTPKIRTVNDSGNETKIVVCLGGTDRVSILSQNVVMFAEHLSPRKLFS